MLKSITLSLILALASTSCSSFTKQGRQERAYSKYIRKSSASRLKQRSRFLRSEKPPMPTSPMPSEPVQTTETTQSAPQAVPADQSQ